MNIKRKLALMTASGMVGVSLIIGGATYAIFSDSASNTSNTVTAGTINLDQERDSGDNVPGPMFYSVQSNDSEPPGLYPYDGEPGVALGGEIPGGWAPGDTVIRAMNLYNRGSLTAKVTKVKANVNAAGVTSGQAYDQFIEKMNIKVTYNTGSRPVLYNGPLKTLLNDWVTFSAPLPIAANSGAMNIEFEAYLDESADNDIMGEDFVFDFTFYAEQARNN
jgi:predicted ribosomally synthesized peptide with SipW-like signal peptide